MRMRGAEVEDEARSLKRGKQRTRAMRSGSTDVEQGRKGFVCSSWQAVAMVDARAGRQLLW